MRPVRRQSAFLVLLSFMVLSPAEAGIGAPGWLMRMDEAAKHVSYTGTFIYHHGDSLQTMRIFHQVGPHGIRERLESLSGVPREIIRGHHQIECYFPNRNALVIRRERVGHKGFPGVLPRHLARLDQHYLLQLGGQGRVAGREAQIVLIRPRDNYRYGYRLWADTATGLLLRSDLVNEKGRIIEQFMFTRIHPDAHIPAADLAAPAPDRRHWWREGAERPMAVPTDWRAAHLPPGFHLEADLLRVASAGHARVQHLVYSDGLAAVSVFIRRVRGGPGSTMLGLRRMGAVDVYGTVVDGRQVTVVGEVPAVTVAEIGRSMNRVTAK